MRLSLLLSWLRLFLIQASWNYDRMIGVGIAFASEPILRGLREGREGGEKRYRAALGRAAEQFNAHPYLAGLAVGSLGRTEHQGLPDEQLRRLRTALAGPLGSVGDKLVWAGGLPVASALGLMVAALISPVAGVVVLLVMHNLIHLCLRGWALGAGWRSGIRVSQELGRPVVKLGLRIAGPSAALVTGLALPVVTAWLVQGFSPRDVAGVGVVVAVGLALARWLWPTLGGIRYGLFVVLLAALAGWL